jgi:hypothetical protein
MASRATIKASNPGSRSAGASGIARDRMEAAPHAPDENHWVDAGRLPAADFKEAMGEHPAP